MDNKFLHTLLETKFLKNSLYAILKHSFLKNLHSSLIFNTTLHSQGFSGIYKTIPNMIIGSTSKVAQPFEVEPKFDELLEWYYSLENITLDDISEFHYRFESIHPFQDGNGRIGRFLMLKQMIENNLPILIVSSYTKDLYINSLNICSIGDYSSLNTYLKTLTDFREDYKKFWN